MNAVMYRAGLVAVSVLGTAVWQAYTRKASPFTKAFWGGEPTSNPPPKSEPTDDYKRLKKVFGDGPTGAAATESAVEPGKSEATLSTLELSAASPELSANDVAAPNDGNRWLAIRDYFVDMVGWGKFVFIDSNLWMDSDHEPALHVMGKALVARKTRLLMLREQYEEMDKLRSAGKNPAVRLRARHAIRLIKTLSMIGAIKFSHGLDRKAAHHVDEFVFSRYLEPSAREGRAAVFVSNDGPFLSRVYDLQHTARERGNAEVTVLEGHEFDMVFDPRLTTSQDLA